MEELLNYGSNNASQPANPANNSFKINELENAVISLRFEIQQQTLNIKNNLSNTVNLNFSALKTDNMLLSDFIYNFVLRQMDYIFLSQV